MKFFSLTFVKSFDHGTLKSLLVVAKQMAKTMFYIACIVGIKSALAFSYSPSLAGSLRSAAFRAAPAKPMGRRPISQILRPSSVRMTVSEQEPDVAASLKDVIGSPVADPFSPPYSLSPQQTAYVWLTRSVCILLRKSLPCCSALFHETRVLKADDLHAACLHRFLSD